MKSSCGTESKTSCSTDNAAPFTLFELEWEKNALEPHVSFQTMDFHHCKHHRAYVNKANELIKGSGLEGLPLEKALVESFKKGPGPLYNNLGQTYNHNIFWQSMTPKGGGAPSGPLADKIKEAFGSVDSFKEKFCAAGVGQFASGWVWLVSSSCGGQLEIVTTSNAGCPLTDGKIPLLVCDVWEHAYYLDYQNRRPDFLKVFVDHLCNWKFAEKQYACCGKGDSSGSCSTGKAKTGSCG